MMESMVATKANMESKFQRSVHTKGCALVFVLSS
jgi:hypothetical protein